MHKILMFSYSCSFHCAFPQIVSVIHFTERISVGKFRLYVTAKVS